MPIVCDQFDLFVSYVPRTGGEPVADLLVDHLGGRLLRPAHASFRAVEPPQPPSIRVVTIREPRSWYRAYWAYARSAMRHPRAWPIWERGDRRHPTTVLDERCGAADFETFVRNALRAFPDGFLRTTYCGFLNGATHVLRSERLVDDLASLLELVGYENPAIARSIADDGTPSERQWLARAVLPRKLEDQLTAVENLDGLAMPYVNR